TEGERESVGAWADAAFDRANGADVELPIRPTVLGKPHIPEDPTSADGMQRCSICEAKLPRAEGSYLYQVTDYIGTDCSGKAVEHRYPETSKSKKAAKGKAKK